jgi:hypothetical protein
MFQPSAALKGSGNAVKQHVRRDTKGISTLTSTQGQMQRLSFSTSATNTTSTLMDPPGSMLHAPREDHNNRQNAYLFQLSSTQRSRCYDTFTAGNINLQIFQPSSTCPDRCYLRQEIIDHRNHQISTLIALSDRCYLTYSGRRRTGHHCFKPHRPTKDWCHWRGFVPYQYACVVSMLTGLAGPVLQCNHRQERDDIRVSMLTGLIRTSATARSSRRSHGRSCFNPHQPRKASAPTSAGTRRANPMYFNPHRLRKAGATSLFQPLIQKTETFQPSPTHQG